MHPAMRRACASKVLHSARSATALDAGWTLTVNHTCGLREGAAASFAVRPVRCTAELERGEDACARVIATARGPTAAIYTTGWTRGHRPPVSMCTTFPGCAAPRTAPSLHLSRLSLPSFARSAIRTTRPEDATFLYHPACLINVYFRTRHESWAQGRVSTKARHVEKRVLADIATLGFAHKPHIVNALRCATADGLPSYHAHANRTFPMLWGSGSFRTVCLQALGRVDFRRSIHLWYDCGTTRWSSWLPHRAPVISRAGRNISVLFLGSMETPLLYSRRRSLLRAARQTRGALVIVQPRDRLASIALASGQYYNRSTDGGELPSLLGLMAVSNYTLCPEGDTPESERIYQAIARGSIPLLNPAFHPPPIADWAQFSAAIAVDKSGRMISLPSARRTAKLQQGLEHTAQLGRVFHCTVDNPKFADYMARALQTLDPSLLNPGHVLLRPPPPPQPPPPPPFRCCPHTAAATLRPARSESECRGLCLAMTGCHQYKHQNISQRCLLCIWPSRRSSVAGSDSKSPVNASGGAPTVLVSLGHAPAAACCHPSSAVLWSGSGANISWQACRAACETLQPHCHFVSHASPGSVRGGVCLLCDDCSGLPHTHEAPLASNAEQGYTSSALEPSQSPIADGLTMESAAAPDAADAAGLVNGKPHLPADLHADFRSWRRPPPEQHEFDEINASAIGSACACRGEPSTLWFSALNFARTSRGCEAACLSSPLCAAFSHRRAGGVCHFCRRAGQCTVLEGRTASWTTWQRNVDAATGGRDAKRLQTPQRPPAAPLLQASTIMHGGGECCFGSSPAALLFGSGAGVAPTPATCEALCLATPGCAFFSHSSAKVGG